jgi:hypothetical protein
MEVRRFFRKDGRSERVLILRRMLWSKQQYQLTIRNATEIKVIQLRCIHSRNFNGNSLPKLFHPFHVIPASLKFHITLLASSATAINYLKTFQTSPSTTFLSEHHHHDRHNYDIVQHEKKITSHLSRLLSLRQKLSTQNYLSSDLNFHFRHNQTQVCHKFAYLTTQKEFWGSKFPLFTSPAVPYTLSTMSILLRLFDWWLFFGFFYDEHKQHLI